MDRARVFRGLRIAWSVGWGIVCLLLVALWVRSYWRWDTFEYPYGASGCACAASVQGVLRLGMAGNDKNRPLEPKLWREPVEKWREVAGALPLKFETVFATQYYFMAFPHWVAILFMGMFGVLPWLRFRFSLRTLLIVTTLVAVGLGLAAAYLRLW